MDYVLQKCHCHEQQIEELIKIKGDIIIKHTIIFYLNPVLEEKNTVKILIGSVNKTRIWTED